MKTDDELKQRFADLCVSLDAPDEEIAIIDRAAAFVLVTSGALSPDEADRLAELHDWPPFTVDPDGPQYDPMNIGFWSLPMVVSWIAFRSVDKKLVPEWRAAAQRWRRFPSGLDIDHYEPMTLDQLHLEAVVSSAVRATYDAQPYDRTRTAAIEAAKTEMLIACRMGKLTINVVDPNSHRRREISTLEWQDLRLSTIDKRDVVISPAGMWHSPTAPARQVMEVWPGAATETSTPIKPLTLPRLKHRGAENLSPDDAPFVELMRELVDAGHSLNKAAEIVVAENGDKIRRQPGSKPESVTRRLRERYKQQYRLVGE